jgi:hypothetical protein
VAHKKILDNNNYQAFMSWFYSHLKEQTKTTKIAVKFGEFNQTRSQAQNRLLWKWHGELRAHIEECTGVISDNDTIHEYVISKIGEIKIKSVGGEEVKVREKTSKMTVKRFTEFLNLYERWARDKYDLQFSHPEDIYWQAFGK